MTAHHDTTILQDFRHDDQTYGYQAACACGWTGLRRLRLKIAARDCAVHKQTTANQPMPVTITE
jgi:hypothetical protein